MKRRTKGQSLVEMALILPIMLLVIFGIVDMSYYIYGYATVYMSVRNGAEKATQIPPMPNRLNPLDRNDICVYNILKEMQDNAVLFPDLTGITPGYPAAGNIEILYPVKRAVGEQIQVKITYNLEPLTPLWRLVPIGNSGMFPVSITTRRSIEMLGNNPNITYAPNLVVCN